MDNFSGNRQTLISIAGFQTLSAFADAMDCESTENLLQSNVDYLSYHITLKLRRVERNPGVLDVVGVVMKHCTMDVLPSLEEIVQDVLSQSEVNFQERNCYSFLKVFHTFVVCMRRLSMKKDTEIIEEKIIEVQDKAETVINVILERYEAKKISENLEDELEPETGDENTELETAEYNNYEGKFARSAIFRL